MAQQRVTRLGPSIPTNAASIHENEDYMRILSMLTFAITGLGFCACGAEHVSAVDESDNELSLIAENPPNPEDPYGSCILDETSSDMFPFECSANGNTCWGWGEGGHCDENGCDFGPYYAVCSHTCETDSECPVPITGDAKPICREGHSACELPCDETTTCPDGSTCVATSTPGVIDEIDGNPMPSPYLCMQVFDWDPASLPTGANSTTGSAPSSNSAVTGSGGASNAAVSTTTGSESGE
jgi:hypothetical protein